MARRETDIYEKLMARGRSMPDKNLRVWIFNTGDYYFERGINMCKTKEELQTEVKEHADSIVKLKKEIERADKIKSYDVMAEDLYDIMSSFRDAGFSNEQAFDMVHTLVKNMLGAYPCM